MYSPSYFPVLECDNSVISEDRQFMLSYAVKALNFSGLFSADEIEYATHHVARSISDAIYNTFGLRVEVAIYQVSQLDGSIHELGEKNKHERR